MAVRQIIEINEDLCDGCELCITACAEGALKMVNGKAKLVSDIYCDGLGVCIGNCPQDAITIIEREAEEFDEEKTAEHLAKLEAEEKTGEEAPYPPRPAFNEPQGHACPGSMMRSFNQQDQSAQQTADHSSVPMNSQLQSWPIQLHLLNPGAPFLQGSDLLLAADCVPFSYPDFHRRFLSGKTLAIACPKLDDVSPYVAKLSQMFAHAGIRSLTIMKMEVPCCSGISQIAMAALQHSGADIPVTEVTIGIRGDILEERQVHGTQPAMRA